MSYQYILTSSIQAQCNINYIVMKSKIAFLMNWRHAANSNINLNHDTVRSSVGPMENAKNQKSEFVFDYGQNVFQQA